MHVHSLLLLAAVFKVDKIIWYPDDCVYIYVLKKIQCLNHNFNLASGYTENMFIATIPIKCFKSVYLF